MTLIPQGAHLAPVDLPPPPPQSDPREPSPTAQTRQRGHVATPHRIPSPVGSRGSSPVRPPSQHSPSSDPKHPLLVHPVPRTLSPSSSSIPTTSALHHSYPHPSRPSSPSSIQPATSTSAIFERDIEQPAVASLTLNSQPGQPHTLTHKASRLNHPTHGSPLDQTVPTVLDDAVEALAGSGTRQGFEGLEIESPATSMPTIPVTRKASAAPGAGAMHTSRSGSPVSAASVSPAQSPAILGQLSTHQLGYPIRGNASGGNSPTNVASGSVPRPNAVNRSSEGKQLSSGWAVGGGTASMEEVHLAHPPDEPLPHGAHSGSPPPAIPSHLTPTKDKRRISFVSYNDLLLSIPTQVTPLGNITSGTMSPDHLPGTISPNTNTRSPVIPPSAVAGLTPSTDHKTSWDTGGSGRNGCLGLGEGEWEREGLGRGLEQRLEDLVNVQKRSPDVGR